MSQTRRARTKSTVLRALSKLRSPPTTSEHEPVWPNLWGSNAQLYGLGPRFCARLVGFWLKVLTASTCIRQDISALHGNILVMIHERNYQHLSTSEDELLKTNSSALKVMERPTHVPAGQRIVNYNVRLWSQTFAVCVRIIQKPVASCSGLPKNNWMFRDKSQAGHAMVQSSFLNFAISSPETWNPLKSGLNIGLLFISCSSFWVLAWGYFTFRGWA